MINTFDLKIERASIWRYYKEKGMIIYNLRDVTEAVIVESIEISECSHETNLTTLLYCMDRYEGIEMYSENYKLTVFPDTLTMAQLYSVKLDGFPEVHLSLKGEENEERFMFSHKDEVIKFFKSMTKTYYLDKRIVEYVEYVRATRNISYYNDITYTVPVMEDDIIDSMLEMIRYIHTGKKLIYGAITKDRSLYDIIANLYLKTFVLFKVTDALEMTHDLNSRVLLLPKDNSSYRNLRETWNDLLFVVYDAMKNHSVLDVSIITSVLKSRLSENP